MILLEIVRFEIACQARRAWPWLCAATLAVVAFLMTRDATLAEALHDEFFINSPFAIAKTTVAGCLIWLLVAAPMAGDAAARDVATGVYPLVYTLPISTTAYVAGRFLAAFGLNALMLLAVQAGMLLAIYLPGVDGTLVGPFRPEAFLTAYGFIALPNVLVATAVQFSVAARAGRPMAAFLGSMLLFFMAYVVGLFLFLQGRRDLANLLDPVGVHFILSDFSHLWTTHEKSWRLVGLEGTVLMNRALWTGVALGSLAVTFARFRFVHRALPARPGWLRARLTGAHRALSTPDPRPDDAGVAFRQAGPLPHVPRAFGPILHVRQAWAIAGASFRTLATSWAGLIFLAAIPLLTVPVVLDQMEVNGVPLVPATVHVLQELTGPLSAEMSRWVIVPLFIVYFAGELVWREREAGLSGMTDAVPGSEWATWAGKFLGLALALTLFLALLMAAGMAAQTIRGYRHIDAGLYVTVLFGLQLPEYLLFAVLALAVHVVVNHKYLGHLAAVLAFVIVALAPLFGLEHNLLIYGAGPGWSYTEMRGFGASLGPWLWFKLYWAAWALLLAVASRLLWVRGTETGLGPRLRLAGRRLAGPTALVTAMAVGGVFVLGGFIYYNTNILNAYRSTSGLARNAAEYERRFGRYASLPQPQHESTTLHVEIDPDRGTVDVRGSYGLVNRTPTAIASIHVATMPGAETAALVFDRQATLVQADGDPGHRIYTLGRALEPGEAVRLDFQSRIAPRGFREDGSDGPVVANGTVFTAADWLPAIGYQRRRELMNPADRRAHGLTPRPLVPSLDGAEARGDRSTGIAFEAVVGTRADQIAVAPGALRRTWTTGGRRYAHYVADRPIGNEYEIVSAAYAVREARWQGVAIRIFHHPGHTAHLDRMVRGIESSLDYYTRHFGPYRYGHLTVVERPGNGTGMHAETAMITHGEGFALWSPRDTPGSLDLPFAVVAHEMAHQWTVPYAAVEGAPVMSESLAWYYGMKAVEHARGRDQLRKLLRFMRQPSPYPPIRRGEPLLRGLDPYLSYRKGPFALYALSEHFGEDTVNRALRRLLERHRADGAPLATTRDLYRALQEAAPEPARRLLYDLFEVNTFWALDARRATTRRTGTGSWEVSIDVRARKTVADIAGTETPVAMDEPIQVGVFGAAREGHDELSEPLHVQMHRIRSGTQTITVVVSREPVLAGIDPFHLLDVVERDNDDNLVRVTGTERRQ